MALLGVSATAVFADDRDFEVVNSSSLVISDLYVAPSSQTSWEEDVLGEAILEPGASVHVTFHGYDPSICLWDVKAVTPEGAEGYIFGVDLCSVSSVTFSDAQPAPAATGEEVAPPADETAAPAEDVAPADETAAPAEEMAPADETAAPSEEMAPPAEETAPAEQAPSETPTEEPAM